jgi:hypothetical protein
MAASSTVADSLEEAGDRLFTFAQAGESIGKCAHCDAIERLHEEFKRRIKTQIVLSSAGTAAMLYWAPLASDQINMRKVDSWQTLAKTTIDQPIYLAAGVEGHRGRSRTASRPPRTNSTSITTKPDRGMAGIVTFRS